MIGKGQTHVCAIIDQLGWAYARRAEALSNCRPSNFTMEITLEDPVRFGLPVNPCDIIFLLDYSKVKKTRQAMDRIYDDPPPLVVSFNTGWPRRIDYFERCLEYADYTIINNFEYWDRSGRLNNTAYLSNGVDLSTFNVQRPPSERKPKVLWCGGTLGSNEWRAELKGYPTILVPAKERLEKLGIEVDLFAVDPHQGDWSRPEGLRDADQMAAWYNTGMVYVCASAVEGTPNPALEAAGCGCAVVSTKVGNMPELIVQGENGYLVDRTVDDVVEHIVKAIENYEYLASGMIESIGGWDWTQKSKGFFDLFQKIKEGAK